MVTSLNFHTFFFEKLIFPTMSKTEDFGQKMQGILGVKLGFTFRNSIVV
jgi:hypothetical protein